MGSILGVIDVLLVFAVLILGNKERCEAITGSSL